jgi:hypothetical protein
MQRVHVLNSKQLEFVVPGGTRATSWYVLVQETLLGNEWHVIVSDVTGFYPTSVLSKEWLLPELTDEQGIYRIALPPYPSRRVVVSVKQAQDDNQNALLVANLQKGHPIDGRVFVTVPCYIEADVYSNVIVIQELDPDLEPDEIVIQAPATIIKATSGVTDVTGVGTRMPRRVRFPYCHNNKVELVLAPHPKGAPPVRMWVGVM